MRLVTFAVLFVSPMLAAGQGPVQFNRDIRPLLSDNCFHCHGPDSAKRKAGLRLDNDEGLFGPRDGEPPVVVKNQPEKSLLLSRILSHDPAELMPPPKTNKKLTVAQKDLFRRWIAEGAPYESHWSFVKPSRPELPKVSNSAWVKNPIDAFILARLDAARLKPAAPADRRALIRRVTLDLTGLPPTPADVEAFVNDKSPNAYEVLVDRLLASGQYGEHRARYWLDAARYGDTHGLHFDNYREMWPYRDWVIRAFNRNLPFDQFTIEQLAGDLLPNRTFDQQIASGFHRCNITTNEGGSIAEEVLVSYARDRVETTATVWLGLTAGCCSCHNHKFDPLAQKEFYQLTAYFRNTTQGAMDGNIPNTPPIIVVPSMDDKPRWDAHQNRAAELRGILEKRKQDGQKSLEEWKRSGAIAKLNGPLDPDRQTLSLPLDSVGDTTSATVAGAERAIAIPKDLIKVAGPVKGANAALFDGSAGIEIPGAGAFASDKPFTVSAWLFVPPSEGNFTIASKIGNGPKDKGHGWRMTLSNRVLAMTLVGANPKSDSLARNTGSVRLEGGKWVHVVVTYDGGRQPNGLLFYLNGKQVETPRITSKGELRSSIDNSAPLRLGFDLKGGGLTDVRVFDRAVNHEEVGILSGWLTLRPELANDPAKIPAKLSPTLSLLFFNRFDAEYRKAVAELAVIDDELKEIQRRSPVTHVMAERPGSMATSKVLFRGQYDQPKEEVKPGVFTVLSPLPKDAPPNRLGLAQWIIAPENPLTARVTVNRFWQEVFGVGLVRTSEDFGSQGETPSHPDLLDWLAIDFRENGWDVKRLIKMFVMSNAYQQAAITSPEARERDPFNRLLSRGPRGRMDGEMLRDQALAASGLLVHRLGGPSVKPYQPPGVWEAVGILGASNTRDYRIDKGEGLYRRSMYWFWKRMSPPPSMEIFNAPSRETCTVRRERTNTPLQALVVMNDPQFVEAARHLGQIALTTKDASDDARFDLIGARLLARPFRPEEHKILRESLAEFTAYYKTHPQEAAKLIAVGESRPEASLDVPTLAAWTMVANQLMNLDEALNK